MNAEPVEPERLKVEIAAKERIRQLEDELCEAEQELEAATDIIDEKQITIECLRIQLEDACLTIDEATATRRKLEERITHLEDKLADEPCHVPVPREKRRS